jgi:hypothetical protein
MSGAEWVKGLVLPALRSFCEGGSLPKDPACPERSRRIDGLNVRWGLPHHFILFFTFYLFTFNFLLPVLPAPQFFPFVACPAEAMGPPVAKAER